MAETKILKWQASNIIAQSFYTVHNRAFTIVEICNLNCKICN